MNLKIILMELGNRLVIDNRFIPGNRLPVRPNPKSTEPIIEFTELLNSSSESRQVLAELGVEWPMSETQQSRE